MLYLTKLNKLKLLLCVKLRVNEIKMIVTVNNNWKHIISEN